MPLVLKTLKTFFLAKTRNRYYCIQPLYPHASDTHTPLTYAYGSSRLQAAPPPHPGTPPPAELPIAPPPQPSRRPPPLPPQLPLPANFDK